MRLCDELAKGDFRAAAVDAPFSVPSNFVPPGGYESLLSLVATISPKARPFPSGADFVLKVAGVEPPLQPPKPWRATEEYWKDHGVTVRSTLWNGPRGGAPFAAACMTLLQCAGRPVWPWKTAPGMLVEAFPAGQLRQWGMPHKGYNGRDPAPTALRRRLVGSLADRVRLGEFREAIENSADALDAVIAGFAAIAADQGEIALRPDMPIALTEGWIAVHN